jgi:hypothetical protein
MGGKEGGREGRSGRSSDGVESVAIVDGTLLQQIKHCHDTQVLLTQPQKATGVTLVAERRQRWGAGNDSAMLLATIAEVEMVVFKLPRITDGGRKDVPGQEVLWRTRPQRVRVPCSDQVREIVAHACALCGVGPVDVVKVEGAGKPEEAAFVP